MRFVEHFTVKEIGIKKTVVYDTLAIYRRFRVFYNPNVMRCSPGRHRKLDSIDIQLIKSLVCQNPCIYLDREFHG
jgi:hypothetical protein